MYWWCISKLTRKDQQTAGDANGQSDDVYPGKERLTAHGPERHFCFVVYHPGAKSAVGAMAVPKKNSRAYKANCSDEEIDFCASPSSYTGVVIVQFYEVAFNLFIELVGTYELQYLYGPLR